MKLLVGGLLFGSLTYIGISIDLYGLTKNLYAHNTTQKTSSKRIIADRKLKKTQESDESIEQFDSIVHSTNTMMFF
jgi:hypothetical protein